MTRVGIFDIFRINDMMFCLRSSLFFGVLEAWTFFFQIPVEAFVGVQFRAVGGDKEQFNLIGLLIQAIFSPACRGGLLRLSTITKILRPKDLIRRSRNLIKSCWVILSV